MFHRLASLHLTDRFMTLEPRVKTDRLGESRDRNSDRSTYCPFPPDQKPSRFFNGPPFKYDHMQNEHTNSVHAVAYSPNGDHFASGGADRKINLYDGKEGKHLATLEGHNGGVFAVSWSKDSKEFASSSGDGSVRVWDVASSKVVE